MGGAESGGSDGGDVGWGRKLKHAVFCSPCKDLEEFSGVHVMADEILAQMERPEGALDPRGFSLIIDLDGLLGELAVLAGHVRNLGQHR